MPAPTPEDRTGPTTASRRLAIVVAALTLLVVAAAVITAARLSPPDPDQARRAGPQHPATTSEPPAGSTPRPDPAWRTVSNPAARLTYRVPPTWTLAPTDETVHSSDQVRLDHLADWGPYTCQGADYGRAFIGSGVRPADVDPPAAATRLAVTLATDMYRGDGHTGRITVSASEPARTGVVVRAHATAGRDADSCAGRAGTITVVALPTKAGTSVVALLADTEPGEEGPRRLADDTQLRAIEASIRPLE